MTKRILIFSCVFSALLFWDCSKKYLVDALLVLENKDTLRGKLNLKRPSVDNKVKFYQNDMKVKLPIRFVKEIYADTIKFIKSNNVLFRKLQSGNVNLYSNQKGKDIFFGGYDADITGGKVKPAIKFYFDDYPNLSDTIKNITNVSAFVSHYNKWKLNHPESKSFFEKNIHHKPIFNLKLSLFLPQAGFELGLGERFSVNSMLGTDFIFNSAGFGITPYVLSDFRFYHNIDKRKKQNKRTYKYSGNYFSLFDAYFFNVNSYSVGINAHLVGIGYGGQGVINRHVYSNWHISLGNWIGYNRFGLLWDIGFGYNF